MIWRSLQLAICLFLVPEILIGQTNGVVSAECEGTRQRMASVLAEGRLKPVVEQYRNLVRFYALLSEGQQNCVTLDVLDRLGAIEQQLVGLTIKGDLIRPDIVLHCESVNLRAQSCTGLEADDMHVRETELLRKPAKLPRATTALTFTIVPGYPVNLIAVYGGSGAAAHLHHPLSLVKMSFHNNTINIRRLSAFQHPVMITIFKAEDAFHFRKFVWFF